MEDADGQKLQVGPLMIWLSFGGWSYTSGRWLTQKRLYWRGYKWTPFVLVSKR